MPYPIIGNLENLGKQIDVVDCLKFLEARSGLFITSPLFA
jgi:hypothetical protein